MQQEPLEFVAGKFDRAAAAEIERGFTLLDGLLVLRGVRHFLLLDRDDSLGERADGVHKALAFCQRLGMLKLAGGSGSADDPPPQPDRASRASGKAI